MKARRATGIYENGKLLEVTDAAEIHLLPTMQAKTVAILPYSEYGRLKSQLAAMRRAMLSASKEGHPEHAHKEPERWDGSNRRCRECVAWNRALGATQ